MNLAFQENKSINRLTALWALSESGLGGAMHALHIPLTGFFVGGFAVIIITLIAHFSDNNFKSILQATLLVILIKAGASPHSPIAAYFAVLFQGICGGIIFSASKSRTLSCLLFGTITLFESAIQKFIIATIIFGKSLWQAIDLLMTSILNDFSINNSYSFSFIFIVIYIIVYTFWGFYLGYLSIKLPARIENNKHKIISEYNLLEKNGAIKTKIKSKKNWLNIIIGLTISFIILYYFETILPKALFIIMRSIIIMFIIFIVIKPLVNTILQKLIQNKKREIQIINEITDELQYIIEPAYQIAKKEKFFINRLNTFIIGLIVLALYNISVEK